MRHATGGATVLVAQCLSPYFLEKNPQLNPIFVIEEANQVSKNKYHLSCCDFAQKVSAFQIRHSFKAHGAPSDFDAQPHPAIAQGRAPQPRQGGGLTGILKATGPKKKGTMTPPPTIVSKKLYTTTLSFPRWVPPPTVTLARGLTLTAQVGITDVSANQFDLVVCAGGAQALACAFSFCGAQHALPFNFFEQD